MLLSWRPQQQPPGLQASSALQSLSHWDCCAAVGVLTAVSYVRVSCLCLSVLQRLLDYIKPDFVHIMEAGKITTTGGMELVDTLESGGYAMLKTV